LLQHVQRRPPLSLPLRLAKLGLNFSLTHLLASPPGQRLQDAGGEEGEIAQDQIALMPDAAPLRVVLEVDRRVEALRVGSGSLLRSGHPHGALPPRLLLRRL